MINVFEPQITETDINTVSEILRSKWIGRGKVTAQLATDFSKVIKTSPTNIIVTNSCTEAAFILAEYLRSRGYTRAFMPSMSFVGVANAFLASEFDLTFIDVSLNSANIEIENVIAANIPEKSILILNQYNNCSQTLDEISEYCAKMEILLIEDAAGAMGAEFNNQSIGTFGDFGIWSLDAMKTISAGDGGIIFSRNPEDSEALSERIYLGLKSESGLKSSSEHYDKWWEFDISGPYSRSIMNDILSGLAVSQLKRLEDKLALRRELTQTYFRELQGLVNLSFFAANSNSSRQGFYLMPVVVKNSRDLLANHLRTRKIYTTFRYFPLHTLSIYKSQAILPNTEALAKQILLLPLHEGLDQKSVRGICAAVKEIIM